MPNIDPLIPRVTVYTCDDFHIISQALWLMANDSVTEDTLLGQAAKELAQYFDLNKDAIHSEHTDIARAKVDLYVNDLFNRLSAAAQREMILNVPANNVLEFVDKVKKDCD